MAKNKKKLFGTDGVRGEANSHPMTAEIALKLGMATGMLFARGKERHTVIIGKDTRLSGYMIEPALTAGFIAMGMDVVLVGPMPTPAIAMLTRSMRADLGVMISASHNQYADNGIKFFDHMGYKLSDELEEKIEDLVIKNNLDEKTVSPKKLGRAVRLDDARGRYIEFVKNSFPKRLKLDGLKIVLDCANGAAYHVAPIVFRELGAEVISIGVDPDGFNINDKVGSTFPKNLSAEVLKNDADLGIALDGDADRLVMCDEKGQEIDGDRIMALIATNWSKRGLLKGDAVVATQMSNMGFEKYLENIDLKLHRAKVGDRYVSEKMRETGINLGGEQSGHIIMSDYSTTGDGLLAALQVLAQIVDDGRKVSTAARLYKKFPQVLINVRYDNKKLDADKILSNKDVKDSINAVENDLSDKGRVFIRASGTEPLIRVMLEGEDEASISQKAKQLSNQIASIK